jgi:SAM-dependent methyltransferase
LWLHRNLIKAAQKTTGQDLQRISVLEVGAGVGYGANSFLRLGVKDYEGVEPTQALRDHVISQGFRVSSDSLPNLQSIKGGSKDFVFSLHVIEHAPNYLEARKWIEEMLRVTKPGGYILICAPDIRSWKEQFWNADWSHGWPTTPQRLNQVAIDLGVNPVSSTSLHLMRKGMVARMVAKVLIAVSPIGFIDFITLKVVNRPLGSGLRDSLFFGLCFVLIKKP